MHYERKVTIKTMCDTIEKGPVIAAHLGSACFFVSTKEFRTATDKHPKKNPLLIIEKLKRYAYYSQEDLTNILKNAAYQKSVEMMYTAYDKDALAVCSSSYFDTKRVLWVDGSTYLMYPVDSNMPISTPLVLDYIHGMCNDQYDLGKAYKILSKNPWVSDLEKIEIPYYNQGEGRTHALEYKVLLPKEVWEKLVRLCRKKDPEYWSCRLKENLYYRPYVTTDLLKVKSTYIKK